MKTNFNESKGLLHILEKQIPNLYDHYNKELVKRILGSIPGLDSNNVVNLFMDEVWDDPMRRCFHCGNLMTEGYLLDNQYACSDECRNALYDSEDSENAKRLYLIDCYMIDPDEVVGLSADEIERQYKDCTISDNVMYTEWN